MKKEAMERLNENNLDDSRLGIEDSPKKEDKGNNQEYRPFTLQKQKTPTKSLFSENDLLENNLGDIDVKNKNDEGDVTRTKSENTLTKRVTKTKENSEPMEKVNETKSEQEEESVHNKKLENIQDEIEQKIEPAQDSGNPKENSKNLETKI